MNLPTSITNKGVTVFLDGRPCSFATDHPSHDALIAAIEAGDEAEVRALADVRANVKSSTLGRVEIRDNSIFVAGRQVSGALVTRILEMVSRGNAAVDGYIRFLDNLMDNPSKRAVDELWGFVQACDLPITADGYLLAYKKVRNNYMDIHSGTFDNSIGAKPSMPRNEVNEDKDQTCSTGLHFCSYSYLSQFGSWRNGSGPDRVMVVKVNPANVVSVPSDYNNAKARACEYEVVGEIENYRETQLTPYFTDEYSEPDVDDDYDEDAEDEALAELLDSSEVPVGAYDTDCDPGDETDAMAYGVLPDSAYQPPAPVPTPGGATLNEVQVANIRALLRDRPDLTLTEIGNAYGVHRETIARIRDGRSWPTVQASQGRAVWPVKFTT